MLRRLHRAGIRRGFVVIAPTANDPRRDATWWSSLCDLVWSRARVRVVLIEASVTGEAPVRDLDPELVRRDSRFPKRVSVLKGLSSGEQSALLEIARAVFTDDLTLLAAAPGARCAALAPEEAEAAALVGALGDLVLAPVAEALSA